LIILLVQITKILLLSNYKLSPNNLIAVEILNLTVTIQHVKLLRDQPVQQLYKKHDITLYEGTLTQVWSSHSHTLSDGILIQVWGSHSLALHNDDRFWIASWNTFNGIILLFVVLVNYINKHKLTQIKYNKYINISNIVLEVWDI